MPTLLATWNDPGRVGIDEAIRVWSKSGNLLDTLEAGLAACERDESLIAIGRGSVPNADGQIELDASIMVGEDLRAGAVCALRDITPAISVARRVLEKTTHVMLAGDQARKFAIEEGFKAHNLHTSDSVRRYEAWLREPSLADDYVHTVRDKPVPDTVTMLGAHHGRCLAASSTSGLSFKLAGRVGDSPIIGAGIYADDEVGCAGATGWGEELWKAVASFRAVEAMRGGKSPQDACQAVVDQMIRRQPNATVLPCVVLALGKDGRFGAATTKGRFDFWSWDGEGDPVMHTRFGPGEG